MIGLGKGGDREIQDYHLTRFACYLIAQNGDPRKEQIAFAMSYFAFQTRKQEILELRMAEIERILDREKLTNTEKEFSRLSSMKQGLTVSGSHVSEVVAIQHFSEARVQKI